MKKKTVFYLALIICCFNFIKSAFPQIAWELGIYNQTTSKDIMIKVYPIGAIFSGGGQYTVEATHQVVSNEYYIFGFSDVLTYDLNSENSHSYSNFDASVNYNQCKHSLGYGKYKIDFYERAGQDLSVFAFIDSCYLDLSDANYGDNYLGCKRIRIDYFNPTTILFKFDDSPSAYHYISEVGRDIRI